MYSLVSRAGGARYGAPGYHSPRPPRTHGGVGAAQTPGLSSMENQAVFCAAWQPSAAARYLGVESSRRTCNITADWSVRVFAPPIRDVQDFSFPTMEVDSLRSLFTLVWTLAMNPGVLTAPDRQSWVFLCCWLAIELCAFWLQPNFFHYQCSVDDEQAWKLCPSGMVSKEGSISLDRQKHR